MTGFSPAVREAAYVRSGGMCERCGEHPTTDGHHRRPRASGGSKRADTNLVTNLLFLCTGCHLFAESHRTTALENGWLVRQGHDPAGVKVLYRRQWALLMPDGTVEYE